MFDVTAPLPATGVRTLRTCSAREHRYAESHRKTSQSPQRFQLPRTARLSRCAALAEARAADYRAEAR